jgi:uncharacterized protein|tara:strand:+ start:1550 stop:1741 length:192 start_codon:yes stop_codon:yes gene_type:complete
VSCPICKAETSVQYRPFCSRRCADIDLAKWLDGSYAVPASEADQDDGREGMDDDRVDPFGMPH